MIVQLMLNKWVLNGVMVGTPVALHGGTAWRAYQSELLLDQLNLYLCKLYLYLYFCHLYLYLYLAAQLGVHIKVGSCSIN